MANSLETAILKLRNGEIIGIPTETVYGLAVDAGNAQAMQDLSELKGRDPSKPFQMMFPDLEAAERMVQMDARARRLAEAFLPGSLTLILPSISNPNVTIGLRIPSNPLTHQLLVEFGRPLAATSANLADEEPAMTASEAKALFPQLLILEGGRYCLGIASTVVDLTGKELRILREGYITKAQLDSRL